MQYFYQESTGGFFCEEAHGENIPKDAIPVSEEQRNSILSHSRGGFDSPRSVSMHQFRNILIEDDLIDVLRLEIGKVSNSKQKRQLENDFEFATTVYRDSRLTGLLNLTSAQWDDFFKRAAKVQ